MTLLWHDYKHIHALLYSVNLLASLSETLLQQEEEEEEEM